MPMSTSTIPMVQIASKKINPPGLDLSRSSPRNTSVEGKLPFFPFRELMKTDVMFDSEVFNTSQSLARCARPGNYGDDATRWLMDALQQRGVEVAAGLGQDYHGWYFCFVLDGTNYEFTLRLSDKGWRGTLERSAGLISSILGGRSRGISKAAIAMIDEVLKSHAGIHNVRWVD